MENSYEKVKLSSAILSRHKLYNTSEYLLSCHYSGFTENYKRVYYKDIQSLHVNPNSNWLVYGFLYLLGAILFGLLSYLSMTAMDSLFSFVLILIFLLAPFIAFLFYCISSFIGGQSCTFTVFTAVQGQKIVAVNTVKKANRLIDLLSDKIAQKQKQLSLDDIINKLSIENKPKPRNPRIKYGNESDHESKQKPTAPSARESMITQLDDYNSAPEQQNEFVNKINDDTENIDIEIDPDETEFDIPQERFGLDHSEEKN